jgi:hypothetical protein
MLFINATMPYTKITAITITQVKDTDWDKLRRR